MSDPIRILRALDTPKKIQDFLETIRIPSPRTKETCKSPLRVLEARTANCMEGAVVAAAALQMHGERPLVIDLETTKEDDAHVIAPFRLGGSWGALSHTNHAVLRFREPIYRNIRELVMSYFHEYFLESGKKTLRSYSPPINLSRFGRRRWITAREDLWEIPNYLASSRHIPILTRKQMQTLRTADPIERKILTMVHWK